MMNVLNIRVMTTQCDLYILLLLPKLILRIADFQVVQKICHYEACPTMTLVIMFSAIRL